MNSPVADLTQEYPNLSGAAKPWHSLPLAVPCTQRRQMYQKRKDYLVAKLTPGPRPFGTPLPVKFQDPLNVHCPISLLIVLQETLYFSTESIHSGPFIRCTCNYIYLLVGGLEHSSIFPSIGHFIIPTDFHFFQRGIPPTSSGS